MDSNISGNIDAVQLLRKHAIHITDLRLEMLETLLQARQPLSLEGFSLRANKTTFYRNMELFEQAGIVSKLEMQGKCFYELAEMAKAHFICDVCKEITDFDCSAISPLKGKVKSVVVKGVCEGCERI